MKLLHIFQNHEERTLKRNSARMIYTIFLYLLFSFLPLAAQPSGGPYGPIQQTYDLPQVTGKIYYVAPDGNADASGEKLSQPTTIGVAITQVKTGDAIVMRGGVYRTGDLKLNQGITIQPYQDERPILKGTQVVTGWEQQQNGLWVTTWECLFPQGPQNWWRRNRHGSDTPQHRFNNDLVFVDGRFLQSAGWEGELDDNSYYINYETKKIYLSMDPREHVVEITAFATGLVRTTQKVHGKTSDKKGPIIKGITFTQYATHPLEVEGYYPEKLSMESEHGKDIIGARLENCTFSYSARFGAFLKGDSLTVRQCKFSDTSTEGLYIVSSSDVLLEKNIFTRNNIEGFNGYYPAAVKIFNQCYRVTCRDNLIIDQPNSTGIWYDVGNVDGVFINNWVENVHYDEVHRKPDDVWPCGAGFYFEISRGAICAGNVFVNCDAGVHLRNAADVQMYNNTFINSQALIGRDARTATGDHFDWHPSTGPAIDKRYGHVFKNNLLVGDESYVKPLLSVWQPAALCGRVDTQQLKELDNNVYVRTSASKSPLLFWSPMKNKECRSYLNSLTDLRKLHPEFSVNSLEFEDYRGPLFKSLELGNFQLLSGFPGKSAASQVPVALNKLINQGEKSELYIGAYPLKE
ncbi:right-handed parallel beta-helix repeat-containing protein [candidate division KSB1 bacterium]|nr:right-handed parallel beta-helix repeat-containing protein [candidate division KSB1 bacterium]